LQFLVDTSILDELSAELCDVVLGQPGSGVTLRGVAAANLLVAPVDRGHLRYRCHPLLRQVLHAELTRMDPADARLRHCVAAHWFGEHGEQQQALKHAIAGEDLALAGELLWAQAPSALFQAGDGTVQGHLDRLSSEQVASVPALALLTAHLGLFSGDLPRAIHWSQVASSASKRDAQLAPSPGFAAGLAVAQAAVGQDGLEGVSAAAARCRELAEDGSAWHAASCLLGGVAEHLLGRERAHARELLSGGARQTALAFPGLQSHCLSQLALMAAEEQQWETAADLVERAGAALERAALCDQPTSALVLAVSAWVCSQQGRIDEAKRDHGRALQMLAALRDFIPWYEVETRVLLARTAICLADIGLARRQLSHASRIARRMPDMAIFSAWFDEAWGRIDGLSAAALDGPSALTMAELRILRFLPTHLSFREIGGRLHVSTNTVKSQVHAVYRKLDAASRSEAVERASNLGLIEVGV
jgi:LuxR family maltose regulon positive regulatory protein